MGGGDPALSFEVAENCLAHTVGNQASQAYNRTTLLELRRPVMQDWANYVCRSQDNVLSISKGRARAPHRRA